MRLFAVLAVYRHPDGRRWIGPAVGTRLAERAMRASGRSAADLVRVPAAEIIRLAAPTVTAN